MKEALTTFDKAVLETLLRTRGLQVATARRFQKLSGIKSGEAIRKRFERLRDTGYLASSKLPSGRQLFRLSEKGVNATGAPRAWANSPTTTIAAEMLSVSSFAWNTDEFLFLTRAEVEKLIL